MVRLVLEQAAVLAQHLDDVRIGVEYLFSRKQRRCGQESAVAAHRIVDLQTIAAADDIVIQTMARRGVHGARAGIERHVLAQDHRHLPIVEGMLQQQMLERRALDARDLHPIGDAQATA